MSEIQDVNERTSNAPNESEVQNDILVTEESYRYTWNLDNLLACIKFSVVNVLSEELEFAGAKWRLQLQASYSCNNDKLTKFKIRLVKSGENDLKYYIKCKFSLVNAAGFTVTRESISSFMGKSLNGRQSSFKCHKENKSGSSFFVIDKKLTVNCELLVLSSTAVNTAGASVNDTSYQPVNVHEILVDKICSPILNVLSLISPVKEIVLFDRRLGREIPLNHGRTFMDSFFLPILIISFLFLMMTIDNSHCGIPAKSTLNMTEVNELILDSTLKIRSIAEALNLTDVKNKSSELLAWYHENYNVSKSIFAN